MVTPRFMINQWPNKYHLKNHLVITQIPIPIALKDWLAERSPKRNCT